MIAATLLKSTLFRFGAATFLSYMIILQMPGQIPMGLQPWKSSRTLCPSISTGRSLRVGVTPWAGFAGAILANGGFDSDREIPPRWNKNYKVDLVGIEDGFDAHKRALEGVSTGRPDECIDVFTTSVQSWAAEFSELEKAGIHGKAIALMAYSQQSSCALITSLRVNNLSQIQRLVTPRFTVAHQSLDDFAISPNVIVPVGTSTEAVDEFIGGKADAIAICDPYINLASQRSSHKLIDLDHSKGTPYVLIASQHVINNAQYGVLRDFVHIWLEGNHDSDGSPVLVTKLLLEHSDSTDDNEEKVKAELGRVQLARYADNMKLFGLDNGGNAFDQIFIAASRKWIKGHYLDKGDQPEAARDLDFIKDVFGKENQSEAADQSLCSEEAKVTTLEFKTVTFYPEGSSEIRPEFDSLLADIASILHQDSQSQVCIDGYTDISGHDIDNARLSIDRARAVANYLRDKDNVPQTREFTFGLGSSNPIISNETFSGREQNRRATIKVVRKPR
jgi:outer membrane protein OmpA-like peptidoglycan-associated protein